MSSPTDLSRRRGACLTRLGRGRYRPRGRRWAGAYLALDAVQDDLREAAGAGDDG